MTKADTQFDEWFARLEAYCRERYSEPYGPGGPKACGMECWRERYDAGDTPGEAMVAEAEHWGDDSDPKEDDA